MKHFKLKKYQYAVLSAMGVLMLFFTFFPYLIIADSSGLSSLRYTMTGGQFVLNLGASGVNSTYRLAQVSILFICLLVALAVIISLIMIFSDNKEDSKTNSIAGIVMLVLISLCTFFAICAFAAVLSLVKQNSGDGGWALFINFVLAIAMAITYLVFILTKKFGKKQGKEKLKNQLQELNAMREEKLITQEEYEALKKAYLNKSIK